MKDSEIVNLYWERSEQAVEETEKKYGSLRKEFQKKFIEYESENSSKNIFDAMINHK